MRIIKNIIIGIIKWASKDDSIGAIKSVDKVSSYHSTIGSNRHGPDTVGMNFTVFNAVGGKVVQFNRYNPVSDRNHQQLYIVADKEDLGQEIGQILTIESLTQ